MVAMRGDTDESDDEWISGKENNSIENNVSEEELEQLEAEGQSLDSDISLISMKSAGVAKRILRQEDSFSKIAPPKSIIGKTLLPFQVDAFRWMLNRLSSPAAGCVLADEMGLGKTIQSLSVASHILEQNNPSKTRPGPVLIIAPLATLGGWENEIKGCVSLKPINFSGDKEKRSTVSKKIADYDGSWNVIITSFEFALSEASFLGKSNNYSLIIIDEAHRLKNARSSLTRAMISSYKTAAARILLTGTPISNTMNEVGVLLSVAIPSIVSPSIAEDGKVFSDPRFSSIRSSLLETFLIRRTKNDVGDQLPSLPACRQVVVHCPLSNLQKQFYTALLAHDLTLLSQLGSNASSSSVQVPRTSLNALATRLRQVASHPYTIPGAEPEPFEEGEHIVNNSGKMSVLDHLLRDCQSRREKVLIFAQFTSLLDIIQDFATMRGYSYERLDGSLRSEEKFLTLDRFQKQPPFIFLLSTRASALGLNLVAANNVVLFESDWNPQIDLQAISRVWRIGQTKDVKVYRLLSRGTVDEVLYHRASRKFELASSILGATIPEEATNHAAPDAASISELITSSVQSFVENRDDDIEKSLSEAIGKLKELGIDMNKPLPQAQPQPSVDSEGNLVDEIEEVEDELVFSKDIEMEKEEEEEEEELEEEPEDELPRPRTNRFSFDAPSTGIPAPRPPRKQSQKSLQPPLQPPPSLSSMVPTRPKAPKSKAIQDDSSIYTFDGIDFASSISTLRKMANSLSELGTAGTLILSSPSPLSFYSFSSTPSSRLAPRERAAITATAGGGRDALSDVERWNQTAENKVRSRARVIAKWNADLYQPSSLYMQDPPPQTEHDASALAFPTPSPLVTGAGVFDADTHLNQLYDGSHVLWSPQQAAAAAAAANRQPLANNDDDDNADGSLGRLEYRRGNVVHPVKMGGNRGRHSIAIIVHWVDNSGRWPKRGAFRSISSEFGSLPSDMYRNAAAMGDLHVGDVHLFPVSSQRKERNQECYLALCVIYSRSKDTGELSKFGQAVLKNKILPKLLSAARYMNSNVSLHFSRISTSLVSRSEWYAIERILKNGLTIFGVIGTIYYFPRSARETVAIDDEGDEGDDEEDKEKDRRSMRVTKSGKRMLKRKTIDIVDSGSDEDIANSDDEDFIVSDNEDIITEIVDDEDDEEEDYNSEEEIRVIGASKNKHKPQLRKKQTSTLAAAGRVRKTGFGEWEPTLGPRPSTSNSPSEPLFIPKGKVNDDSSERKKKRSVLPPSPEACATSRKGKKARVLPATLVDRDGDDNGLEEVTSIVDIRTPPRTAAPPTFLFSCVMFFLYRIHSAKSDAIASAITSNGGKIVDISSRIVPTFIITDCPFVDNILRKMKERNSSLEIRNCEWIAACIDRKAILDTKKFIPLSEKIFVGIVVHLHSSIKSELNTAMEILNNLGGSLARSTASHVTHILVGDDFVYTEGSTDRKRCVKYEWLLRCVQERKILDESAWRV